MKKVLIVTALAGFINAFLINDIISYQKKGFIVECAANNSCISGEDVRIYLNKYDVKFYDIHFDSKKPLAKINRVVAKELKKLIFKNGYSIIHVHTPIPALYIRIYCRKLLKKGVKIIYSSHGLTYNRYSSFKNRFIYKSIEKYCSKYTSAIICINKEDFGEFKKMHCKDVFLLPSVGFDFSRFYFKNIIIDKDAKKKQLGIDTDKIMILSVGELSLRKNHQCIIRAISLLNNKKDYVYVICGREIYGSSMSEQLHNLADDLGVELITLGHRKDIPEIMRISDIGAIPSLREGFGMAGVQSLAAGVPLVGTSVQGILEYIIDGKTGFLAEPNDYQKFADNILKLSNTITRDNMVDSCIEIAKKYDVSNSCKVFYEIISNICGE